MIQARYFLIIALAFFFTSNAHSQNHPFPQHTEYTEAHIKPSQYSQVELDNQVTAFYDKWKNKYLINGCESNHYYIFFDSGNTVTVSEAMGYGMMIIPLMAGYDENARTYFNGLYRYYKAHPSVINNNLMAWKQITGCVNSDGPDSAADGDIDIAFGLLLAHAQWGSWGSINYYLEAEKIINAIMEDDVNSDYWSVKLGDWVSSGPRARSTRSSDFIFDHFRIFECAVDNPNWNLVVDQCYSYIQNMQENYSPETGLIPDFIVDINTTPRPADPDFLEGDHDGEYSYNACRDPWRIGNDFLISGDERAHDICLKINRWLLSDTDGDPNDVKSGYSLNGDYFANWKDLSFMAPFTVGAMVDTANQQWLNNLYAKTLSMSFSGGGYYGNSLKLLSMITISGNYWVPGCDNMNGIGKPNHEKEKLFDILPNIAKDRIQIVFKNENTNADIQIISLDGKIILNNQDRSNIRQLDVSALKTGLYIVSAFDMNTQEQLASEKLIIRK